MVSSVAILRESKTDSRGREVENRVVLIPSQVEVLKTNCPGLEVFVEHNAGAKIDFPDANYKNFGARICSHDEALEKELILGVKETKHDDFAKLRAPDSKLPTIFMSYQHFAQSRQRTEAALQSGATFIALETMETNKEGFPFFPCLAPMSEAAAKVVARHADEYALIKKKIITSGLPETGLHGTKAVILGGGSVGKTATEEFAERGCEVLLLDKIPGRVKSLAEYFLIHSLRFPKVIVMEATAESIKRAIAGAFFLVSAMYTSGKKPEKIVTLDLIKTMAAGGCVYPIDIDQGGGVEGIFETSILDPFDLPVFPGTDVSFFAAPNLPSMGARTTSEALGTVILPHVIEIINMGLEKAAAENPTIKTGINIQGGKIVHPGLASVFPN